MAQAAGSHHVAKCVRSAARLRPCRCFASSSTMRSEPGTGSQELPQLHARMAHTGTRRLLAIEASHGSYQPVTNGWHSPREACSEAGARSTRSCARPISSAVSRPDPGAAVVC